MIIFKNLFIVVSSLSLICMHSLISQSCSGQVSSRSEVITVFKEAIDLNENFKSKFKKMPLDKYDEMRKKLEKYHEQVLTPKLPECVNLLSSGRDNDLAVEFLRLLISFENSADEQLSFSFGEIFINNPILVVQGFDKFDKSEQDLLYRQLQWGWMNVVYSEDIPDQKILDSLKKLKHLRSQVYSHQ